MGSIQDLSSRGFDSQPMIPRIMKKTMTLLILSLALGLHSTFPAHLRDSRNLHTTAANQNCAEMKFHNLSRYKGQGWSRVFVDREIAPALRALLKGDMATLKETLKEA